MDAAADAMNAADAVVISEIVAAVSVKAAINVLKADKSSVRVVRAVNNAMDANVRSSSAMAVNATNGAMIAMATKNHGRNSPLSKNKKAARIVEIVVHGRNAVIAAPSRPPRMPLR